VQLHSTQGPVVKNQILCCGPYRKTKFAAVNHSASSNSPQWTYRETKFASVATAWKDLKSLYTSVNLNRYFKCVLDHESGGQFGTVGEIPLGKKSHASVPFTSVYLSEVKLSVVRKQKYSKKFYIRSKSSTKLVFICRANSNKYTLKDVLFV
jgi:hypothetical protein